MASCVVQRKWATFAPNGEENMQYDLTVTQNPSGLVYFRVYSKETGDCKCVFSIDPKDGSLETATGDEEFTGYSIIGELV